VGHFTGVANGGRDWAAIAALLCCAFSIWVIGEGYTI